MERKVGYGEKWVNIPRDVIDPHYRYQMPEIRTKVEGKGNGIKTVIENLSLVATALARPGPYIIKYFGFELGAQTTIGLKDDRWIINGIPSQETLQTHLDGFIKKFVLCKRCKNPETHVHIKDGAIILDCQACGQQSDVDLTQKLSGFILKSQPKKGKKDKAERRAAKKAKQNGTAKEGSGSGGEDGSDNLSEDDAEHAGDAEVESDDELQKLKAEAAIANQAANDDKEDEWAADMSEAAVKARQDQLPDEFKQKLDIGAGGTVFDQLGEWILEQANAENGIDNVKSKDIEAKIQDLDIDGESKTVQVLANTLFDANILEQIPKRSALLQKVIGDGERNQMALLGGTERRLGVLGEKDPKIYSRTAKIVQLYYNEDLVSEDVVKNWGSKASKKYTDVQISRKVRKAAKPFLDWLDEASEEEDDDDDE